MCIIDFSNQKTGTTTINIRCLQQTLVYDRFVNNINYTSFPSAGVDWHWEEAILKAAQTREKEGH